MIATEKSCICPVVKTAREIAARRTVATVMKVA